MGDEEEARSPVACAFGAPWWYDLPEELVEGRWRRPPGCEGPDGPPGQLWLAHQLWNRLVEYQRDLEAARAAIWVSDPAVAAAQAAFEKAQQAVEDLRAQAREDRARDRTTVPRDDRKAALEEAKAARAGAKAARDDARGAAIRDGALRDAFTAALREHAARVRALYPEFTGAGLGWATYNDVARRRFAGAVGHVEKARERGEPAQLRFRRWDGTGTITVQVMGGAGVPPRTMAALNSGRHPRSGVLRVLPRDHPGDGGSRRGARYATVALVIGRSRQAGPLRLEVPVAAGRPVPPAAEVREVKVTRYREGPAARVRVSLSASVPASVPPRGPQVAVRLSWRAAGGGWVTVAHAGSPSPLPPLPPGLGNVVRLSGDRRSAEVMYRPDWRRLLGRDQAIRGARDQAADAMRGKLATALRADAGLEEALGVTAGDVARWKSPGRLAALARPARDADAAGTVTAQEWAAAEAEWKAARPQPRPAGWRRQMLADVSARLGGAAKPRRPARFPVAHPLAAELDAWLARDVHLRDFEAGESGQVLRARQDAYKKVAAWLCSAAGGIVIDGTSLGREAHQAGAEDPEGARGARRLAHSVAPGELRAAVTGAAGRRGIPVTEVKAPRTGRKGRAGNAEEEAG